MAEEEEARVDSRVLALALVVRLGLRLGIDSSNEVGPLGGG